MKKKDKEKIKGKISIVREIEYTIVARKEPFNEIELIIENRKYKIPTIKPIDYTEKELLKLEKNLKYIIIQIYSNCFSGIEK